MGLAEDRQYRRIVDADQLDLQPALCLFEVLYGRTLIVDVAVPGDLFQHPPDNSVRANRRLTADASYLSADMEALSLFTAFAKMRIHLPRSHNLLAVAVDVAFLVLLARPAPT
jgi:hypothetical protein